jgi:DNA-binding FadR family transcriptional regulator
VSNEIPNADWLPRIDDIAARYVCAPSVAREAVRALAERGIVHERRGRRHQVNDAAAWNLLDRDVANAILLDHPTSEMVRDAVEAVKLVQTQAAVLAAERSLSGDVKLLDAWIDWMRDAVAGRRTTSDGDDAFVVGEAHFNDTVTRLSNNRYLVPMLSTLHPVLATARRLRVPERDEAVIRLSETIVAGIAAGDPAAAAAAIETWGARLASWLKI